jgi:hypothetical protein
MADQNENNEARQQEIRQHVERAVAQVLQAQIPQLQSLIVEQVVEQVLASLPSTAAEPAAQAHRSGALVEAVANIHAGSTQKEILRALLEAGSGYCSRIALFVVKGGNATGWQSRGFGDEDAVKDFALDLASGPAAHIQKMQANSRHTHSKLFVRDLLLSKRLGPRQS